MCRHCSKLVWALTKTTVAAKVAKDALKAVTTMEREMKREDLEEL